MNHWIVIVDDETLNLINAKTVLKENDMRVNCLRSGEDLLEFMEKNEPDLILLDIMMPEMDGFETYHALRRLEEKRGKRQTPVIFLTSSEDSETERRGLKAGASDFIRKPFDRDILIQRIHNTILSARIIENLTEEVTVDKLTGLLNKAAGTERIVNRCKTENGSLMIFDLDNFKLVNDLYGHDMGDRVLKAFASVARHNMRAEDAIARIGGDEFMAFCLNMSDENGVAALTRRLNEQILLEASRLMGEEFNVPLGVSVGVAMVPEHGRDYEILFSLADNALYKAKQSGKHSCVVYHPEADAKVSGEGDIEDEIVRVMKIVEERNDGDSAFLLEMEQFSFVYRFAKRLNKRYGGRDAKLLFILRDKEGDETRGHRLKDTAAQFALCLQDTLRKSDVILQSKPNHFFILLPELKEEDFPKMFQRIMTKWEKMTPHGDVNVDYAVRYAAYEKPSFNQTNRNSMLD